MSSRREISDLLTPWRNSFRTSAALIAAVAGRPRRVPLCRAWSSPARTRSRRISCSKAANTESMPAIARPVDVVRSSASLSETKPMLRSVSSWSVVTKVEQRTAPPIQSPDQHDIDLTSPCRSHQLFAKFALHRTGTDFFDLNRDLPAALRRVLAHASHLQRQSLLILCGYASVEPDPQHFRRFPWLAENPL